jgi:hypothetical protein
MWFRNVRCQWCGHSRGARAGNWTFYIFAIHGLFNAPSWGWFFVWVAAGLVAGTVANAVGRIVWGDI